MGKTAQNHYKSLHLDTTSSSRKYQHSKSAYRFCVGCWWRVGRISGGEEDFSRFNVRTIGLLLLLFSCRELVSITKLVIYVWYEDDDAWAMAKLFLLPSKTISRDRRGSNKRWDTLMDRQMHAHLLLEPGRRLIRLFYSFMNISSTPVLCWVESSFFFSSNLRIIRS